MTFSKTLEFPENVEDLVVSGERRRLRRLQTDIKTDHEDDQEHDHDDERDHDDDSSGILSVYAVSQSDDPSEELEYSTTSLLATWDLESLNGDGISVSLNFTDPILLSSGGVPDLLALQFDIGKVVLNQDENFPNCIVKYIEIPPQVEKGKLE